MHSCKWGLCETLSKLSQQVFVIHAIPPLRCFPSFWISPFSLVLNCKFRLGFENSCYLCLSSLLWLIQSTRINLRRLYRRRDNYLLWHMVRENWLRRRWGRGTHEIQRNTKEACVFVAVRIVPVWQQGWLALAMGKLHSISSLAPDVCVACTRAPAYVF